MEHLADAWARAEGEGVESEAIARAAASAALAALVLEYGEETVAEIVATLPDRILSGEFSIGRTLH